MAVGTFGTIHFDGTFATKVTKRLPTNFKYREAEFLEKAADVVESLKLKSIRIPVVYDHWVEGRKNFIKMDQIHPPTGYQNLTVCKFWGSGDKYEESWDTVLFDNLKGKDKFELDFDEDSISKLTHELGQFHRGMMELGIGVWEVEIMIGKLSGDDHLSFFLLDFDKAGLIDFSEKDICKVKGMSGFDVSRMLVQESYPKPGSDLFLYFVDGFSKGSSTYIPNYSANEIDNILKRIPTQDE